ncbi:hypothetical protein SLS53_007524 [Cytospora paraplurivora]|uniref:LysM domain-containing protein n=1 Tax=Cytospora paraplurivora TaxID=2898453 RepID=A0AAN9YCY7_9PEZI
MKISLSSILPGQASEACCTCASILSEVPRYNPETEKPYPADRRIASDPSSNPLPQGLREPPSYETATSTTSVNDDVKAPYTEGDQQQREEVVVEEEEAAHPPPYTSTTAPTPTTPQQQFHPQDTKSAPAEDTLHFVHPSEDTIPTLSIRYNVPAHVLRRHNRLTSDHLLSARRTVLIPGAYYPSGVSLRPRPAAGEEEEARRGKVRRWMVACRCADYDVAELYLAQSGYDLDGAVGRFLDDERWEREHPQRMLDGSGKGKGKGKDKGKGSGGGVWAGLRQPFLRRQ